MYVCTRSFPWIRWSALNLGTYPPCGYGDPTVQYIFTLYNIYDFQLKCITEYKAWCSLRTQQFSFKAIYLFRNGSFAWRKIMLKKQALSETYSSIHACTQSSKVSFVPIHILTYNCTHFSWGFYFYWEPSCINIHAVINFPLQTQAAVCNCLSSHHISSHD